MISPPSTRRLLATFVAARKHQPHESGRQPQSADLILDYHSLLHIRPATFRLLIKLGDGRAQGRFVQAGAPQLVA